MRNEAPGHVLIAGLSCRALAISAVRAGYKVTAVDGFGDRDLREVADVLVVRDRAGRYRPQQAARLASKLPAATVTYTSSFENSPRAVALLAQGKTLLGNPAEVVRHVRNPIELMRVLRLHNLVTPVTLAAPPRSDRVGLSWLLKPRRSGGGHGIEPWYPASPVPRNKYLQERIEGIPGSVIFAADGRNAVSLAMSRQLVGDVRFGAHGFRYCGSLLGPTTRLFPREKRLLEAAVALAELVTREFHLVGVNGIDFLARCGRLYPIEVNPRYSASMELLERAGDLSVFEVHALASTGVLLPPPAPATAIEGKAIVFARRDVIVGDSDPWMRVNWLADVPAAGERIARGRPICTVFARGSSPAVCVRRLVRRAASVYRAAESRRRRAA